MNKSTDMFMLGFLIGGIFGTIITIYFLGIK